MSPLALYFGFTLAGLIFGFGAALTILFLGIMSLRSHYWFHILNGTDRITIPMLWFGSVLLMIGVYYLASGYIADLLFPVSVHVISLAIMVTNGAYLTFVFAPVIRKRENDGKTTFLKLPMPHQILIFVAGTISAIGWFSQALMLWLEVGSRI